MLREAPYNDHAGREAQGNEELGATGVLPTRRSTPAPMCSVLHKGTRAHARDQRTAGRQMTASVARRMRPQSKLSAGSTLRPGATSLWPRMFFMGTLYVLAR